MNKPLPREERKTSFSICLAEYQVEQLDRAAHEAQISRSELVRNLIDQALQAQGSASAKGQGGKPARGAGR